MLTLSRFQFESLIDTRQQAFAANFLPVARHDFPELWSRYVDEEVRQILLDQCASAAELGIASARGVYLLFTLRVSLGSDFPLAAEHAWAREILCRQCVGEPERLDALETAVWGAPS